MVAVSVRRLLVALFAASVALKLLILAAVKFPQPLVVMDETLYFLQAREIWLNHSYVLDARTFGALYPPLYPLVLSPLTVIADVNLRYLLGLAVNAFVSSLVVFPAYGVARFWLDERRSLLLAAVTAFAPLSVAYSFTWMSENLYVPLFLAAVYFVLKERRELAGFTVGLATLTKVLGLALLPFVVWKFRRKALLPVLIALLMASTHFFVCLTETGEPTGYNYSLHSPSSSFATQLFLAAVYLVCATAPSLLNLSWQRHKDIIVLVASYTLLVAFASQLPLAHGRYYECLIPVLLIPAFDVFTKTRTQMAATAVAAYLFFLLPSLVQPDLVNASLSLPLSVARISPLLPLAVVFPLLLLYVATRSERLRLSVACGLVVFILVGSSVVCVASMQKFSYEERNCCLFQKLKELDAKKGELVFVADLDEWWANYCLCCFYAQHFIPVGFTKRAKYAILETCCGCGQKHITRLEPHSDGRLVVREVVPCRCPRCLRGGM